MDGRYRALAASGRFLQNEIEFPNYEVQREQGKHV
jgi:hypothetical protein